MTRAMHEKCSARKTSLTLALYILIDDNFEGVCFLEKVREISQKYGLILRKEGVQIIGVKGGISQKQSIRLSQMKMMLIAIVEKSYWFHLGSKIIITTRDKHLLTLHDIERTYEVQGLNKEGSLDLFHWKAFKIDIVNPRYENVSFDTLGEDVQRVFLDIACYFKGYNSWKVTDILQAHYGSCMKYYIGMLVEKSLIK
ncbi:hypothetical protein Ahy_A05g023533 [Arachis hypogaea]|uniref:NB-ARC domain-containing protein n=1 Tax=Arachis hypogaea TaxID=3818 RepID=A0A445D3P9_ARAHY|nr:hypothetical protein Ahy_A05g023533 [Arachis hypogaea]